MLISQGFYRHPRTGAVPIAKSVQLAVEATRCYVPADLGWLLTDLPSRATRPPARFEVTGETSLQAARRLSTQARGTVGVLNFASATKPGGGYLTGATAQEEDMCRCSSLYRCLLQAGDYYPAHRTDGDPFYSHRVIYSPAVPVFRDHANVLLPRPYPVTFLSCPAPNAGKIAHDTPDRLAQIPRVLTARAAMILAVAYRHDVRRLVLGAWGCGVFRNAPNDVAAAFKTHLISGGQFFAHFEHIIFAVRDKTPRHSNLTAFKSTFERR